jgi:hypothetical protein
VLVVVLVWDDGEAPAAAIPATAPAAAHAAMVAAALNLVSDPMGTFSLPK